MIYIYGILTFVIIFIIYKCITTVKKLVLEYYHVNKNKNYIDIQQYFSSLAYDSIYKDQILGYTAEGFKISGDELETAKRNFIKLVIQLLGPTQHQYLINLYGSPDNLYSNLLIWFTAKLDTDEIYDYTTKSTEVSDQKQKMTENVIKTNFGD